MGTATTSKPVNLYQLGQEMGGSPSFRTVGALSEDGSEKRITSPDVDDGTLRAALDSHVADPSITPPATESEHERAEREFREAVEAASSVADLKAALLGSSGPGAEPRRPR